MAKNRPAKSRTPRSASRAQRLAGLLTVFVLGFALAFVIGTWTSGPDATERRIAELEQAEARRDVEQIGQLTELARGSRDRLTPVLQAMAKAAPLSRDTPRGPLTAHEVDGWRTVLSAEVKRYEETPSSGNGVNVARTAMRTSVRQLATAADGFAAAVAATGPLGGDLVTLAGHQRDLALQTWSVAALQLDVINVDAGNGHVHVQLPSGGDSGTIPLDGEPEGIQRR
ncbi:hypothetical protein ADK67_40810 [Saccharothrix sp. NRRL B-16348]|uniref:hypothetical protein n=1 Tax=Saccharothrix sp. NRRL B-16348 TaxID=1415542 RepID=UPI0006AED668|nr:hypothetical protein [Saccharothrix sp. NRRL B-16348]KOX16061.1 hypothetical protein ADK67_40810 [Saccharothrix sp. NRRL B-16348]